MKHHSRVLLCGECEENDAKGYCHDCEQSMCEECSKNIHNKGARKRHVLDAGKLTTMGFVNCVVEGPDKQDTPMTT